MKKYSDDPIVNFIHNEREARYQRLVKIMGEGKRKSKLKSKAHGLGKTPK